MTLGEKQELFQELSSRWKLWVIDHPGWKLRAGEGRILPLGAAGKGRRARDLKTGKIVRVRDLVHKENGNHYKGLAEDPQLFVDGNYITDGDHPAWKEAGARWQAMHELCRWGGDWGDANHISLEHEGIK